MVFEEDIEWFKSALATAAESVSRNFFQLPVAGQEDPAYRERVYCYELYHQLRSIWPFGVRYSLGGEVDKAGHRLIRKNALDRAKPDLIAHVPGDMESNLAVVEVKPRVPQVVEIASDLRKLAAFRRDAYYASAIYLVYGVPEAKVGKLLVACKEAAGNNDVDLVGIELMVHTAVGKRPKIHPW
jgi:hypothetical protein